MTRLDRWLTALLISLSLAAPARAALVAPHGAHGEPPPAAVETARAPLPGP